MTDTEQEAAAYPGYSELLLAIDIVVAQQLAQKKAGPLYGPASECRFFTELD